jgi:SecD/SecF fusion protein
MRSKGAIKFFAVALVIVCLYQLSFTVVTSVVEGNAPKDPEQKEAYLDSMAQEPVYNLLVKEYTYNECKAREINLGLDLQGGMHVTLQVSLKELLLELSNNNDDESFRKALKQANQQYRQADADFITAFRDAYRAEEPDGQLAAIFATRSNQDEIDFESTNQEVISFLRQESNKALDRTYNILRTRVNQFGVSQPNIQKIAGSGRIIVELPGVEDQERVRSLLKSTAKLGFWETYKAREILPYFEDVNDVLQQKLSLGEDAGDQDTATAPQGGEEFFEEESDTVSQLGSADTAEQQATAEGDESDTGSLFGEGEDTTQADTGQLSAEEFRQQNPLYSVLRPAVSQQGEAFRGPVVGFSSGLDTSKVNEYLSMKEVQQVLPTDVRFYWSAKTTSEDNNVYQLYALKETTRDGSAPLTGQVITEASVDVSERGQRQVAISMNSRGARIWERITGDNIDQSVAISMDERVYSAPNVNQQISGGRSVITGRFTTQEAQDLANVLEAGKLPIVVNIVEEAVIGPSLGQESIQSGLTSLVIGLVVVLLFMVFYYNQSGLVANLALLANLFFIVGVLASLGAALTLPGMAGVLLTVGMSVDANVLIFERVREEIRGGKGLNLAIADGYRNAYSSIVDANLTTLLTAIILYTFGSGPISGFAIILIIGILTSLFSAIFITRLIFEWALNQDRAIKFASGATFNALTNFNIDFLSKKKIAYFVSGGVIIAGAISLIVQGVNYGIDFKGGYSYVVQFDEPVNSSKVRNALSEPLNGEPQVKTFGPSNQVKITSDYLINSTNENASDKVRSQLDQGLSSIGNDYTIKSSQKVGPTIAEDIKTSAYFAVTFSLIVIFLYIFLRFQKWQYGLGALAAVFHDVLIVLGLFSILKAVVPFPLKVDQAFIAAILTVVGYSINDTVVVYDRIREKLNLNKKSPFLETVNRALNDTLSRTFITSFTTLIVILILFLFGGEMIRGFSFALLIGILVGTYSSLFVSSNVVVELTNAQKPAK